mmetsp:Transcript_5414/g.8043  ORF Transcript_5414/g.8043 Transcript_5414/m.8043 type:complete len:145 (+) Transcript_5414:120-554(+)
MWCRPCCAGNDVADIGEGAKIQVDVDERDGMQTVPGMQADPIEDVVAHEIKDASPKVLVVEVEKAPGEFIGLDFNWGDMKVLKIDRVRANGLVAKWNSEHPETPVQKGDFIEQVNDKTGNSSELMQMLQNAEKLKITIGKEEKA